MIHVSVYGDKIYSFTLQVLFHLLIFLNVTEYQTRFCKNKSFHVFCGVEKKYTSHCSRLIRATLTTLSVGQSVGEDIAAAGSRACGRGDG